MFSVLISCFLNLKHILGDMDNGDIKENTVENGLWHGERGPQAEGFYSFTEPNA